MVLSWVTTKVSFLGPAPQPHMKDIYHNADVYVNSSFMEAFTLSVLEAMVSGVPVIASAVGGTQEIVAHEETGLLFQPGDAGGLAGEIIRLLGDEELRLRLRKRAILAVQGRYSWDTLTQEPWRQYQAL